MDIMRIILIVALCIFIAIREKKNSNHPQQEILKDTRIDYKSVYQSKWMFTYNEKDLYRKLKEFADGHGLAVFAKVRLFDLVEPREKQDKSARYKIQSKHVDFVLCNDKMVAKYIIELDDQSHDALDRKNRDAFVDEILTACGYKVVHMRAYDEAALIKLLEK